MPGFAIVIEQTCLHPLDTWYVQSAGRLPRAILYFCQFFIAERYCRDDADVEESLYLQKW